MTTLEGTTFLFDLTKADGDVRVIVQEKTRAARFEEKETSLIPPKMRVEVFLGVGIFNRIVMSSFSRNGGTLSTRRGKDGEIHVVSGSSKFAVSVTGTEVESAIQEARRAYLNWKQG